MASIPVTQLSDYRPSDFRIVNTNLSVFLEPSATRVVNSMLIRREASAQSMSPLVLNGEHLQLIEVKLDGRVLAASDFTSDAQQLTIPHFPDEAELCITTQINPEANTRLEGLYMSAGRFFTQCESEGFRCITYYLDRPDVLSLFTTTIWGNREQYPYLLSNGNCIAQGEDAKRGLHYCTWHNPYPMPCYLFALVAGQFTKVTDDFTTRSGRCIPLDMFVLPAHADKCQHALAALKAAMAFDEEKYGREYDLDRYMICAVDDFNSGAMENKGLNIFNAECVLANEATTTDDDFEFIEAVVGHEYFHNWTGNRVTCRDWFQLCLKEGLTMYREQQFMASVALPVTQRIQDVRALQTRQFAEDAGPMSHPVQPAAYQEIRNFYTFTVYNKGAEIYRMLNYLLGDSLFRSAMDRYFSVYDGCAVTIAQFVENMQTVSGKDLSQFHLWYTQSGTPIVRVNAKHDAKLQQLKLTFSQTIPPTADQRNKQPMQIPIAIGFVDEHGNDLQLQALGEGSGAYHNQVVELTQASQCLTFDGVANKPVLSLLRGFSAPIKIEYDYTDAELRHLWQFDSDDFNRWSAGQRYLTKIIFSLMDAKTVENAHRMIDDALHTIQHLLNDKVANPALIAELITLPSESYCVEWMSPADIDGIIASRDHLKHVISEQCHDLLRETYKACMKTASTPQKYVRKLKNIYLDYLAVVDKPQSFSLLHEQYLTATNMTDKLAALSGLSHSQDSRVGAIWDDFYQQYHDDTILVNKWFAVQAGSRRDDTPQRLQQLLAHDAFSLKNPNNVRALIGTFCQHNLRHFHKADGSGYAFLADQIIKLDAINPHSAARMITPLTRWRQFDTARSALLLAALKRIANMPNVSNDLGEIIQKTLRET